MKKLIIIITLSIFGTALYAQTPQAINYQGVARDGSGNVLANQTVALKLSLLQGSASGTAIYIETHAKTTDAFGLFALQIGQGSVVAGVFSTISWGANTYYLKVEIDPAGGTAWQLAGTNQFVSVPYALYAKESGTAGPTGPTGPTGLTGADGADGADGANGDRYSTLSSTSLSISTGAKSLVVGTGLSFTNGQTVVIANSTSNYMTGLVTGYTAGTGLLNVTVNAVTGSGTFSLWNVNLSGAVGPQGAVGATGAQGIQGIQGIQGPTGAQGIQGIQGIQGPTGNATISGTTNYVVKFTGSTVGGNSLIYDNGTNVGIGTTSPTYKFDVVGADARFNGITIGRGASSISSNTAIGNLPLNSNTTGGFNTAVGYRVLYNNTEGQVNCGLGYYSLYNNTTGTDNTAMGYYSLYNNKAANKNTAIGAYAMFYAENTTTATDKFNTAVGYEALKGSSTPANNTGDLNTAVGSFTMRDISSGWGNTAVGTYALTYNTSGDVNCAIGNYSLHNNTSGNYNLAVGRNALTKNVANSRSTAIGNGALQFADNRTTGRETFNTAIGYEALRGSFTAADNTGQYNTAIGDQALLNNTSGYWNLASGSSALINNTTGSGNTAVGKNALYENTVGFSNTAIGNAALNGNVANWGSTAIGYAAMLNADNRTTGRQTWNTAVGYLALAGGDTPANNTGQGNTAIGSESLNNNETGGFNTAVGRWSLFYNVAGSDNTAIGYAASANSTFSYSNTTTLGYDAQVSASNQVRLGNSSVTSIGGYANWSNISDVRFKKQIQDMNIGLDFIMKLRPVTYHLDMDAIASLNKTPDSLRLKESEQLKSQELQTGFIAQEVEQAANELGYDFSGVDKPKNENDFYGLRYAEFVVPLVKGMQEQQQQIEELKKIIEQQQKQIELLLNKQ